MKRIVIILALMMIAPLAVSADETATAATGAEKVNYERPYYNQPNLVQPRQINYAPKKSEVYKPASGNAYILKYNIDDLESAPWINGGKRKI